MYRYSGPCATPIYNSGTAIQKSLLLRANDFSQRAKSSLPAYDGPRARKLRGRRRRDRWSTRAALSRASLRLPTSAHSLVYIRLISRRVCSRKESKREREGFASGIRDSDRRGSTPTELGRPAGGTRLRQPWAPTCVACGKPRHRRLRLINGLRSANSGARRLPTRAKKVPQLRERRKGRMQPTSGSRRGCSHVMKPRSRVYVCVSYRQ